MPSDISIARVLPYHYVTEVLANMLKKVILPPRLSLFLLVLSRFPSHVIYLHGQSD